MYTSSLIPLIFGLRGAEWIIILVVVLLLFGGKKIPELMKGLGKGVTSFKKGVQEAKDEINRASADTEPEKTASEPRQDTPSQPRDHGKDKG